MERPQKTEWHLKFSAHYGCRDELMVNLSGFLCGICAFYGDLDYVRAALALSLSLPCVTHWKTQRKFFLVSRSTDYATKREYSWSNRDSVLWEAKAICGTTSLRVTVLALFYESVKSGTKTKEIENSNSNKKLDKRNKTTNPSEIDAILRPECMELFFYAWF